MNVFECHVNGAALEGSIAQFRRSKGTVGFVVTDPSDHEFRNGIKGHFGRFAHQDITDANQQITSGHRRKVILKSKQGDGLGWFRIIPFQQIVPKLHDTIHIRHISIVQFTGGQRFNKGSLHVSMITGIQKQLDLSFLHQGRQGDNEFGDKLALGTSTTDGNQETDRLVGIGSATNASGTRFGNALDQIAGTPVTGTRQLVRRNTHAQKVMVVGGSLHEIQRPGHHHKPLCVIVNDQVNDVLKAGCHGGRGHQTVRGHNDAPLVESRNDGPQVLSHLIGQAQGIFVSTLGESAPGTLRNAAQLGGPATALGVELVRVLNEGGFGTVNVQKVVEVGLAVFGGVETPGRGGVGNAVVSKAHADRANDERWHGFPEGWGGRGVRALRHVQPGHLVGLGRHQGQSLHGRLAAAARKVLQRQHLHARLARRSGAHKVIHRHHIVLDHGAVGPRRPHPRHQQPHQVHTHHDAGEHQQHNRPWLHLVSRFSSLTTLAVG
mmetsp:Transcript_14237/g.25847  ORF Transcript_14237/g.25847 Transcript_14237/m.25847 type:complete len:492 (+) Transcript_14237:2517-3992(+)